MPLYQVGEEVVRRKNLYMPCVIGPKFDEATPEEKARILRDTWWADLISNSEWKVLLTEDFTPSAKSRLKKKAAGWLIALGRIAVLNPKLYNEVTDEAQRRYEEQIGKPHPVIQAAVTMNPGPGVRPADPAPGLEGA